VGPIGPQTTGAVPKDRPRLYVVVRMVLLVDQRMPTTFTFEKPLSVPAFGSPAM
jgi:hypothetical protein